MATQILVSIDSGNGLLPDGAKPLPEPMLTYRKYRPVTFIWGNFTRDTPAINHENQLQFAYIKFISNLPRANWLNINNYRITYMVNHLLLRNLNQVLI